MLPLHVTTYVTLTYMLSKLDGLTLHAKSNNSQANTFALDTGNVIMTGHLVPCQLPQSGATSHHMELPGDHRNRISVETLVVKHDTRGNT